MASLGSFVSGIAVLVSLIYLALQVRQTEKNQRALLIQGALNRSTESARWMGQPEISALLNRAHLNEGELSGTELWQLIHILRTTVLGLQDAYLQYEENLVDKTTLDQAVQGFQFFMSISLARTLYAAAMRQNVAPDLQVFIDRLLAESPLRDQPIDLKALVYWGNR